MPETDETTDGAPAVDVPDPDYVRVKDRDTGHEFSVRTELVNDEAHEVLDKPALGHDGLPAPVKYRTSIDEAPAKTGRPYDSSKTTKNVSDAAQAPGNSGQSAGSDKEN